jgi:hypothetical protein
MQKYKNLIIVAMLILIGTVAYYGMRSQVLILSSVDIQAEAKALELAKLSLKRQRIAYQSEHVGRLGLWQTIGVSVIAAVVGSAALCGVTYAIFAGAGLFRQRSLVPQVIGGSTLTVHYRTVKDPVFAVMMTGTLNIEAIRAQNPQIAAEMAMKLVESLPRLAGRLPLPMLPAGEVDAIDPIPAPPVQPSSRDILLHPRHDGKFVAGFDADTKAPVLASLEDDIFHLTIAGQTGSGKTTTLRFYAGQWLVNDIVQRLFLADSHPTNREGLTASMGELVKLPQVYSCQCQVDAKEMIERFYAEMIRRVDEQGDWSEAWVLVCDEGLNLLQNIAVLKKCLEKGSTESRKFGMFLILAAQTQKHTQIPTEIRDNIPSMLAHRMKPVAARTFLQSKDRAKLTAELHRGQAYFVNGIGTVDGVIDIPLTTAEDIAEVVKMVGNGLPVVVSGVSMMSPVSQSVAKQCETPGETVLESGETPIETQIKQRLRDLGKSQNALADTVGVSRGVLSKKLHGQDGGVSEELQTQIFRVLAQWEGVAKQRETVLESGETPIETVTSDRAKFTVLDGGRKE